MSRGRLRRCHQIQLTRWAYPWMQEQASLLQCDFSFHVPEYSQISSFRGLSCQNFQLRRLRSKTKLHIQLVRTSLRNQKLESQSRSDLNPDPKLSKEAFSMRINGRNSEARKQSSHKNISDADLVHSVFYWRRRKITSRTDAKRTSRSQNHHSEGIIRIEERFWKQKSVDLEKPNLIMFRVRPPSRRSS